MIKLESIERVHTHTHTYNSIEEVKDDNAFYFTYKMTDF